MSFANATRVCAFGIVEPTIVLFGHTYGVCAMAQECPPGECSYTRSRRIIAEMNDDGESAK